MLKFVAAVVLAGFLVSIGGHLPALQAIASLRMMEDHCKHDSILNALKETIMETVSGRHNCALCRSIRTSLFHVHPAVRAAANRALRFDSFRVGQEGYPILPPLRSVCVKPDLILSLFSSTPPFPPPRIV